MVRRIVLRLLLCSAVALPAASALQAAGSAAGTSQSVGSSSLQLYANLDPSAPSNRQLQPLDMATLAERKDVPPLTVGNPLGYRPWQTLASRDGTILVAVSSAPTSYSMTQAQEARAITVRVIDARTGLRRAQFHPSVPLWIDGISPDGSQLYGLRMSTDPQARPEWDVLSAQDGRALRSLELPTGCCAGGYLYDAPAARLYTLEEPQTAGSSDRPATPILAAYDLTSGKEVGRLTLDGVLAGSVTVPSPDGSPPIPNMWQPGLALSPDGGQIAVLDGQSNRLTLIDTRGPTVERTESLSHPESLLERVGQALGLLPAEASAKEWLGVQLTMSYAPDGRHLYVTGRQGKIGPNGKWTIDGLGLRLVDAASGQVTAQALPGQNVPLVAPAPDGSALYTEASSPTDGSFTLRRHDPATLAVTAQRALGDYTPLFFLASPTPGPYPWLQAWPMASHDPQRTGRSPAVGPVEPNLLFDRKGLSPLLAGPDGTIYASSAKGLVALDAQGRQRWTAPECCEGLPVLAPDGMTLGTGFHTQSRPAGQADTEAIGIEPDGTVGWRVQPFGLLKGAVPLVTESNLLYLPVVGPNGADAQGLDVLSAEGKQLRKLPLLFPLAVAPDGAVFGVDCNGALDAISSDGRPLWQRSPKHGAYGIGGPLVGQGGVVYAGLGKEIDAFSGSGQLLWRYRKADGALTLAERSDGVLLVAGRHDLDAVQPDGKQLWGVQIGSSRGASAEERPFLLVDGDDTAYVGTGDGSVWVISAQGQWLSDLPAGGHENHRSPGLLLGPDGRLLVSGTDRVMRVYG